MTVLLNEVKQAEKIIKDGSIGSKPSAVLFLLSKYYRQKMGLDKTETALRLNDFMQMHYQNYNPALWEDIIENLAKKKMKYPLREIDSVNITHRELEYIKKLQNPKYERLVFVMLCHAKLYNMTSENNNGWVNTGIPEIYRLARVTVKYRQDIFLYLNNIASEPLLGDMGLISFSTKNDNLNLRVNFVDMNSGQTALSIDDFRELGLEYQNYYQDGNFKRCEKCRRLIRLKSKKDYSTKYCAECAKYIKNTQNKLYYRKNKSRKVFQEKHNPPETP